MLWGAIDSTHQSVGVGGGGRTRPNDCAEVACLSAASQQNAKLWKAAAAAHSNKRGSYSVPRKIHYSACPSFTPVPMSRSGRIGIKKRKKERNYHPLNWRVNTVPMNVAVFFPFKTISLFFLIF